MAQSPQSWDLSPVLDPVAGPAGIWATPMMNEFSFDYILTKFKALDRSLEIIRDLTIKILNAVARIENEISDDVITLREIEES